jgi:hypothetical protein
MHDSSGGTLTEEEDCGPTVYWFSEIHKRQWQEKMPTDA